MKTFRKIFFAMMLICAFTIPALADGGDTPPGDGHTPGAPAPGDGHSPGAPAPVENQGPTAAIDNIDWSAVLLALDLVF